MKPTTKDSDVGASASAPTTLHSDDNLESLVRVNRRQFLTRSAASALGAATLLHWPFTATASSAETSSAPGGEFGTMKKAVCIGVLPRELSLMDRFKLAKKVGIEGVEPNTIDRAEELKQVKEAAEASGIRIHSIMNSGHWQYPLSDNDPVVVAKCIEGIKTSLHNAHDLGADTVLLVPAVVTPKVRYAEAYQRSQEKIRELLPLAEELRVIIAIENVGNKFLLSPLEFARYVDEMNSPWLQAYFDIGNLGNNGYPQDWIRTLGKRLVKVHIKQMEPGREPPANQPRNRRTEGIDWIEVRRAFRDIGYHGWFSAEVRGGDEAYLQELSRRMDKFVAGESPV